MIIITFSVFINCGTWEAVYIIDGLLKNESEIQPDTLHADTQGQSTTVFGLSNLLGIQLQPRIRNVKDLIFYRAEKGKKFKYIDALFSETIDWNLIDTHWQDLMQVVLSIKAGKICPQPCSENWEITAAGIGYTLLFGNLAELPEPFFF